jgi:hypothetical protein
MKTDAAIWNRAASIPAPEVGAVDINPFNYLSAGMQGAFGGLLGKAASDIESVEKEVQKQAKRAKGAVEKAMPPEPARVPSEPEQRPSNVFRRLRGMSVPWYRQSWVKLAAIGAAGMALGGMLLRR